MADKDKPEAADNAPAEPEPEAAASAEPEPEAAPAKPYNPPELGGAELTNEDVRRIEHPDEFND